MARETWNPLSSAEQNQTEFKDPNVIDGDISGNAATANKLKTAVTINGVSFDGSANITIPTDNTVFIAVGEVIPRTTSGTGVGSYETAVNGVNYDTVEFDSAANEHINVIRVLPSTWNGGTITAEFFWTAASGPGTVTWGIQAYAFGDNVALDSAWGSAQVVSDTLQNATRMHISPATPAITVGGSPAAGIPIIFQVYRDVSDTLAVDAHLIGFKITFNQS